MGKGKSLKINALLNVIKQICAVIFPMITFPYVSRVLGVEAYGKVNTSVSLVGYFSLIAGLGVYSYSIREGAKIRDDEEKFGKFTNEVFSINVISTIIAYIFLFTVISFWGKISSYRVIILVLSINILLITLGTDWINAIHEDFLYLTVRYIVCQSIAVILTFVFVKEPDDLLLYAFISNLGTTSANLLNLIYIRRKLNVHPKFTIHINARKHIKPIMILFGNMISSMIYLYSDSSMLGLMVGDVAVGYYSVASKIYSLVKQTLNSISSVAIPRFSHQLGSGEKKEIKRQVNDLLGTLLIFLLPAITGLICIGEDIIVLMSGVEYKEATSALVILSIALLFSTIAGVFVGVVMLAYGKDKEILISTTISAIVNVILNIVLIPYFSFNAAATTTLISELIMLLMGIYFTRGLIKIAITKYILTGSFGCVLVVAVYEILKHIIKTDSVAIRVVLPVAICGAIYMPLLFVVFRKKKVNNSID